MDREKRGKLNRLEQTLPEGLLVDAAWLEGRGYYPQLRKSYVDHGWLVQPARGVYRRPRGSLRWEQVVTSLQALLKTPVVVGGRTALELEGYAHYLPQNQEQVHLYGPRPLPAWTTKLSLDAPLVFHRTTRLFPGDTPERGLSSLDAKNHAATISAAPAGGSDTVVRFWGQWDWPLVLSTPERALLELLDELPDRESFHQVDVLVEGLSNLSPRRMKCLLLACHSVKVRRLFFFFADRHRHAWRKHLDREAVDLGSGKRMLVRGGRLDSTYLITVPEDLDGVS